MAANTSGKVVGASGAGDSAKEANPPIAAETPKEKTGWARWGGITHTVLDIGGLIPVVGIFADAANAGIYLAEGNLVEAGISAASAGANFIPGGGAVAKGTKLAVKAGEKALLKAGEKELAEKLAKEAAEKLAKEKAAKEAAEEAAKKKAAKEAEEKAAKDTKIKNDCSQFSKGPPGASHKGGQHKEVVKDSKWLERESHHIPPHSVSGTGVNDGPAISMDYADHRKLSSTGRRATDPQSITQAALAKSGSAGYLAAMMLEVTEIKKNHGNKYDLAITWMLLWAACKGYIPSPSSGGKK
jgi:hypothetical protein